MNEEQLVIPGAGHATLRAYVTGFMLSLVLTVIPFALVIYGLDSGFSYKLIVSGMAVAAVIQVIVHLHYFLHLDRSSEQSWNMQAIVFTVLIIAIMIAGSLWIMFDLYARMM